MSSFKYFWFDLFHMLALPLNLRTKKKTLEFVLCFAHISVQGYSSWVNELVSSVYVTSLEVKAEFRADFKSVKQILGVII